MTTSNHHDTFKVLMHPAVGDLIDESFSGPMDGAIAVAQIYDMLPLLHRSKWWHRLVPNHLRVYRGLIEWGGVGFRYVQVDHTLHVLDGGYVPSEGHRFRHDIVLPTPDAEKYITEEHGDVGVVFVVAVG